MPERYSDEEDKIPGEDDDIDLYGNVKHTPQLKPSVKTKKLQQEVAKLESSPRAKRSAHVSFEEENLGSVMAKLGGENDYGDEEEEVVPVKSKQFLFGAVDR